MFDPRRPAAVLVVLAGLAPAPAVTELSVLSRAVPFSDTAQGGSQLSLPGPHAALSADGRYTVYLSTGMNLVSGQRDTPSSQDVFLFDRVTGQTRLVSRAAGTAATAANGYSSWAAISADGAWIAFASLSTDLVAGQVDTNGFTDLFLYNRLADTVTLVSHTAASAVTTGGGAALVGEAALSGDGRYLAFVSEASDLVSGQVDPSPGPDVFLYDRTTGTSILVSRAVGTATTAVGGRQASLSADGRHLAFTSGAANLVSGQVEPTPGDDVFLFDRTTGLATLVSHVPGSAVTTPQPTLSQNPVVSADGNFVAFLSVAHDLIAGHSDPAGIDWDVFLYDRATGANTLASHAAGSAVTSGDASALPTERLSLSADGRYVLFASNATNLVDGQVDAINGELSVIDLFLHDRNTGATSLVSHTQAGAANAANQLSIQGVLSADGELVAFASFSPSLSPGQLEGPPGLDADIFLYRRSTGTLTLVSRSLGSPTVTAQGFSFYPAISADGGYVAFSSSASDVQNVDANTADDVFLFDRTAGTNAIVSRHAPDFPAVTPRGESRSVAPRPSLSADGRYVAFSSSAFNLGFADANNAIDLFLADRLTGAVRLVDRTPVASPNAGNQGADLPTLSADGRYVAFRSASTDLVSGIADGNFRADAFLWDRETETVSLISRAAGASQTANRASGAGGFALSADGRWVAFDSLASNLVDGVADSLDTSDVFLFDRVTGTRTLVSHQESSTLSAAGGSAQPYASADGGTLVYGSSAADLVAGVTDTNSTTDVFLYDRGTNSSVLVSRSAASPTTPGNNTSLPLGVSADGGLVLYSSHAHDLVSGQVEGNGSEDLFLFDRAGEETVLVSRTPGSPTATGNAVSSFGVLSGDGRYVAFQSFASNLVAGQVDTNGGLDVFLFDRLAGTVTLVSRAAGTSAHAADGPSRAPAISADGRFVAFESTALDLVSGFAFPGGAQVYLFDRQTGTVRLVSPSRFAPNAPGNGISTDPALSADGRSLAFTSLAEDLVQGDFNLQADVFLDRATPAPGAFFTLAPCRLLDTRQEGPPLTSGQSEVWPLFAACGIPSTAKAVSINLTVVAGNAGGFVSLFPGDQPVPTTSMLNFRSGQVKANNAVMPLALDGSGTLGIRAVFTGSGPVHVILDVNGYFE